MDHATTMRSVYERINAGDLDGFAELVAEDFIEHEETPGFPSTKAGTLDFFRMLLTAFPGMQMAVEDVIGSDDKMVARVTASGIQKGDFMGVPASGKSFEVPLIDIMLFDDAGLVCEHWGVMDMLSMLQQLGAVPDGLPA
jgi:steroid delta-isomerase-like uncharacterized protein